MIPREIHQMWIAPGRGFNPREAVQGGFAAFDVAGLAFGVG
jgi:hypothetical protein